MSLDGYLAGELASIAFRRGQLETLDCSIALD